MKWAPKARPQALQGVGVAGNAKKQGVGVGEERAFGFRFQSSTQTPPPFCVYAEGVLRKRKRGGSAFTQKLFFTAKAHTEGGGSAFTQKLMQNPAPLRLSFCVYTPPPLCTPPP